MKNAIQTAREISDGILMKKPRQKSNVPRYMSCLTHELTPVSIKSDLPVDSRKTAVWDFATRYEPKQNVTITKNTRRGRYSISPITDE